jgi:predicted amidohydrolase
MHLEGDVATMLFRVAVVQMSPCIGERGHNRQVIVHRIAQAAQTGASLIVFPECAVSGYVFDSAAYAQRAAETVPGETSDAIAVACQQFGVYAVVGMLERDRKTRGMYNSAILVGPSGIVGVYRKCHLPVMGVDRYIRQGNELPVFELPFARIGVLICYDLRFPEAARLQCLRGADMLVIPTNWPRGAESAPDFLTRARAWENRVFVVACNRVGVERGTRFIGRSQIVSPDGKLIAEADAESETMVCSDIDPALARLKRLIIAPGEFELDPVGGRRPELYGDLARPN